MDTVDAAAGFGVLAGVLSAGAAYFTGLVVALAAITVGLGAARAFGAGQGLRRRGRWALGFGVASAGWVGFLWPGLAPPELRGAVLGGSLVPLWLLARQARPFGGV